MLEIRRIIQLWMEGKSNRKIAQICGLSRPTVDLYVSRLKKTEKPFTELLLLDDESLAPYTLSPKSDKVEKNDDRHSDLLKRLPALAKDLENSKVTRMFLWEEYREEDASGYSYTQFCEILSRYLNSRKAVLHLEHLPGEELFFDYAGDMLSYVDLQTGEVVECPVYVAVLPFSSLTYVEAQRAMKRENLLSGMNNMLIYFGGVTQSMKSDNMAQYVKKADKYEPVFDELVMQWSHHYNTTLLATRVRKPKDKASVESAVNTAYRRVYAYMHRQVAHSLEELNSNLRKALEGLNTKKMQKHAYSRMEHFISHEKQLLRPLPEKCFIPKSTVDAKVRPDYHVTLGQDKHYYSVPHQYIGRQVRIVYDIDHVEIYLSHSRIAVHQRDYREYAHTTIAEHMPKAHQIVKGWNPEYFLSEANKIGPETYKAIAEILKKKHFKEQNYNSCRGLLNLATKYPHSRMEAACTRALRGPKISSALIKNILERNLDKAEDIDLFTPIPDPGDLRGKEAYEN